MLQLVKPALEFLPEYKAALERGWSADNVREDVAAREELQKIATDPAAFVAALDDPQAKGGPIKLPDGSTVPRLPGFRRWMWDGAFCGSIGLRWQPGTSELPPHVLGHIGYAVVPWKRGRGYAKRALALMLVEARGAGLTFVYVTARPDNVASQAVIRANGGRLVERFQEPAAYGGSESLRFRIDLKVEAALIALRPARPEDLAFCRRVKDDTMRWIITEPRGIHAALSSPWALYPSLANRYKEPIRQLDAIEEAAPLSTHDRLAEFSGSAWTGPGRRSDRSLPGDEQPPTLPVESLSTSRSQSAKDHRALSGPSSADENPVAQQSQN